MSRTICRECGTTDAVEAYGYCGECSDGLDLIKEGKALALRGFGYTTSAYARSLLPAGSNSTSVARLMGWTYTAMRDGVPVVKWDSGRARQRFFQGDSLATSVLIDLMEALDMDTRDVGPLRERAKFHCHCGEPMITLGLQCGFCAEEQSRAQGVLLCA